MKKKKKRSSAEPAQFFGIRTDLAVEAKELIPQDDGVRTEVTTEDDFTLTKVQIYTEDGAKKMGKPKGTYLTFESEKLKENDTACHNRMIESIAKELRELAKLKENASVLVVGLGNWNITPDALGPKVVHRILVTRHLKNTLPKELMDTVRPTAAISPGVMGITGIETGEIVKGIVEKIHPDLVIAVDALAARKFRRINTTIQMADTGVCPGSGVGNKRMSLDEETLGVPVIALGVPTVVDAATLVYDTMEKMLEEVSLTEEEQAEALRQDQQKRQAILEEMLTPYAQNMFVTPKEVDAVIDRLADIIANAINIAVHPGITMEDINQYVF